MQFLATTVGVGHAQSMETAQLKQSTISICINLEDLLSKEANRASLLAPGDEVALQAALQCWVSWILHHQCLLEQISYSWGAWGIMNTWSENMEIHNDYWLCAL